MRLDRFWIGDYKNLKDVTVDFDEDHWVTVVIGWNGTGKSNVLEALATLFRDLLMGENNVGQKNRPSFPYKIAYRFKDKNVFIDADPKRSKNACAIFVKTFEEGPFGQEYFDKDFDPIKAQGEKVSLIKLSQYVPKYIFGYYSGHSDRLAEVFRKYLAKYDRDLRNGKDPGLRRLFYALPVHSQFVLLAFVLQQDAVVKDFLNHQLGLEEEGGIDSVLFVLREPPWKSTADDGDPRFWNARGVVKNFLVRLYCLGSA